MKTKSRIFIYLIAFLLITFPAHSGNLTKADFQKLDPQLYFILSQVGIEKPAKGVIKSLNILNGSKNVNVVIKSTRTRTELAELGVRVYSQFGGDIFTANISINQIENLITNPNISYIQKSKIVAIQNDKSMTEIKAPQARQQYNITGKGVIIGIIDTGIDWQHSDFRNPDGTTRIKALLDLSDPGDTNGDGILDGPDQYGGTFYSEQQINNALNGLGTVNETDEVGHGTHVAGSAAGNGRATSNGVPENTFVGVAPEADLIIVKGTREHGSQNFSDVDYLNGIEFINNIASEQNKSCVINLSLGGSSGPHDGKDLSEQAIDELLSGSSAVGKAVVISAGNDGNKPIHASGTLGGAGSSVETKFDISSFTPTSSNLNDYVIFDGWYDGDNDLSVKVVTSSGRTYGPLQSGRENGYDTPDGAVYISNAKGGASNLHGDKQLLIQIYDYYDSKPPKAGEWKIVISGTTGRFDLWLSGATMEASITSNLDY